VTVVATGQSIGGVAGADVDEDGRDDLVLIPANEFVTVAASTSDGPTYAELGGGLAGATTSSFDARGALLADEPFCWTLVDAPPLTSAFLVAGATRLGAPFKGGTLVPEPTVVIGLPTDADGRAALGGAFPSLAGPFDLAAQFWFLDPAGPAGFAATPAILATVP